jgi:hypothetical protein
MKNRIFTDDERQILESNLISAKVDKTALDKLLKTIMTDKGLFDDIFLYLQVKKSLTS